MTSEERDEMLLHGALAERERIIALLEAQLPTKIEDAFDEIIGIAEAIALIKGDVAERRQTQMSEYGDKGENE